MYKEDKDFEREEECSSSECRVLVGWNCGEGLDRDPVKEAVISLALLPSLQFETVTGKNKAFAPPPRRDLPHQDDIKCSPSRLLFLYLIMSLSLGCEINYLGYYQ